MVISKGRESRYRVETLEDRPMYETRLDLYHVYQTRVRNRPVRLHHYFQKSRDLGTGQTVLSPTGKGFLADRGDFCIPGLKSVAVRAPPIALIALNRGARAIRTIANWSRRHFSQLRGKFILTQLSPKEPPLELFPRLPFNLFIIGKFMQLVAREN